MKHKIINLSLLVLLMNVLTASKESICIDKKKDSVNTKDICLQAKKAAANKAVKQTAVVKEKANDNANAPLADYKMPVIPFSRFIL